jgi:8-hydroxy-5-deazaflavin:NADPH oxidoreductase
MAPTVAIVGGTGPLGRGIAARLVRCGVDVHIGSRDPARARAAADEVAGHLDVVRATLGAGDNLEVVGRADLVIVAVPFAGLEPTLERLGAALDGRIVVSAVNPLRFDGAGPVPLHVPEGSAAELIAARSPRARVVAALHSVAARTLTKVDTPLDDDVPVLGDDADAVAAVAELLGCIDGCRPVVAGPLRLASVAEGLTCLLLSINRVHRAHVGVRFSHLGDPVGR